jgi:5-methylthioadenosine/S-adenosylhomocysteine deaminase
MRYVARTFSEIDPHTILRMGTLSGAEALGRAADVGSITPGKLANLVAVPMADDASGAADELLVALLSADHGSRGVWLRGEKV